VPRRVAESAALVTRVREYERNCRCPKCHGHMASGRSGPLACVDCDFCLANLRKLMLGELGSSIFFPERHQGESQRVASEDFPCVPERIGGNLLAMKPKTRKTRLAAKAAGSKTAKAKSKAKPKSKIGKVTPARKAPKVTARKAVAKGKKAIGKKAPASVRTGKKPVAKAVAKKKPVAKARPLVKAGHAASDAGRIGVFVRFETAADKDFAAKASEAAKANSLSAYSAHFALEAAQAGKKMELKPRAVEKGEKKDTSSEYDRRNFTRFATPTQKGIVAKAAKATGVSLSAYIVHFTMEAAKAKAKLPEKEQEPEAVATGT
jgi:hypothetical protein